MKIVEIKIKDLPSFVNGKEFRTLSPRPITELRAISQFNNPDANGNDLALIYLSEEDTIVGFVGLLPRFINGSNIPVFSNTCWWTHPTKGKGSALPLFLKLIKITKGFLYISDTTSHVKTILDKTELFESFKAREGIRGFMCFYFADIFQKKFPKRKGLYVLTKLFDGILNFLWKPFRLFYLKKFRNSNCEVDLVSTFDEKLKGFVKEHSKNEFIQKSPKSFQWVKGYPWVKVATDEPYDYPFTHIVKAYELNYYTLKANNEIVAFFAISNRDNLAKIPYIYFKGNISEVVNAIMSLILEKKYSSLLVFHPEIVEYMNTKKMPFLYRKSEVRFSGACKQVSTYFNEKSFLQDGDGDVIFT